MDSYSLFGGVAEYPVVRDTVRQQVRGRLSSLYDVDNLRGLFCQDLDYKYEDRVIDSRRFAPAAEILMDDPRIIASSPHVYDEFPIFYSHLRDDSQVLTKERVVVEWLTRDYAFGLFVFSDPTQSRWHFVNVKSDTKKHRRATHRRITVAPGEGLRTASERLAMIHMKMIEVEEGQQLDMFGVPAATIQKVHDRAFDVSAVTQEFFSHYRAAFERVKAAVSGIDDDSYLQLFTQKLFNRLMFIAFVQKKGWLNFKGHTSGYMPSVWNDYQARTTADGNFYRDRLYPLFDRLNGDEQVDYEADDELVGKVYPLNGGLFEINELDRSINVPDDVLGKVVADEGDEGLFARFNFTVTENTPLEIEVAIDPEMLGKVFEELVTGRHESGSYYTPKQVVSFMCRQALKGYLESKLPNEPLTAIEQFVDHNHPEYLRNAETVLDALRSVQVCDPACGSGAYLLGMMQELLELRMALFNVKHLDPMTGFERKEEIIKKNIFGVDVDPFAVSVAQLRLWLSLAVDYEGDKPLLLPNLNLKIALGDSLTAPDPSGGLQEELFRHQLVEQLCKLNDEYFEIHGSEKHRRAEEIAQLKQQIRSSSRHPHNGGFDWKVEFINAFDHGGFDITIANPPYVRADAQFKHVDDPTERAAAVEEWKKYRQKLVSSNIYQTTSQKWDLYVPFLERAYQLLRSGGQMVFIISDAYNAAKYASKSHEFFLNNSTVQRIDFCSDIPIFSATVNNTIIHFTKAVPSSNHRPIRIRRFGNDANGFEANAEILATEPQAELGIALFRMGNQEAYIGTEGAVELGEICYISVGMVVNADEKQHLGAFSTDELLSETIDAKHPKAFILGKDVTKWKPKKLRFLEWGTQRAPSMFRRQTFFELYLVKEKIISMRTPGATPRSIYDDMDLHFDASSVGIIPWHYLKGVRNNSIKKTSKYIDQSKAQESSAILREELEELSRQFSVKYLLAVMNSAFAKAWLTGRRRSKLHIYPDDWKRLPIAAASREEQEGIAALVDQILIMYKRYGHPLPDDANRSMIDLEREIDQRVSLLYRINTGEREEANG